MSSHEQGVSTSHRANVLLQVRDLSVSFHIRRGVVPAVDGVSFDVERGKTLGIVGESGSGKSVSCAALMGLLPTPPARIESGTALFGGHDLLTLSEEDLLMLRGDRIAMIFQDPMTALNPFMRIEDQLCEPLIIHKGMNKKEARVHVLREMELVGIRNAESRLSAYPHEFSGGMRQRIVIAMALITRPAVLIADEPTTALDVTIQKQILTLIRERRQKEKMGVILISHDLGVMAEQADVIQVMYAGRTVESAPTHELLAHPMHAYTRALLKSIPGLQGGDRDRPLYSIPGMPPDLLKMPKGCSFRFRNTLGNSRLCLTETKPELVEIRPGHFVQNCPGCLAGGPGEGLISCSCR